MKKILLSILLLFVGFSVHPQLTVTTTETPQQLVINTFAGPNVTISNIKFNGTESNALAIRDQVARFSNGDAGIGAGQGLLLATGKAIVAAGPNNASGATNATSAPISGDSDLALIADNTIRNVCIIEFDFIPTGNTVLFEYIFASEEYPEFTNSSFNDAFGLFLSGPGISGPFSNGAINIATIPGTAAPVTINNLNNGISNNGPCEYCQYYVNNGTGSNPILNPEVQYDGLSTEFTASGPVTTGQTHHLKFAIANVGDNALDSAIFLTAGSLRAATLGNESFATEKVKMYPNPATDFIHIKATDDISKITIYDVQGRALLQTITSGTDIELNTQSLSTGTYIVEFVMDNYEKITQKLVIR
jgi:hypothetical protein